MRLPGNFTGIEGHSWVKGDNEGNSFGTFYEFPRLSLGQYTGTKSYQTNYECDNLTVRQIIICSLYGELGRCEKKLSLGAGAGKGRLRIRSNGGY